MPRQFSEWSFQKIIDIIEAVYTITPRRVNAFNGLREEIVCLFQRDEHRREFLENIDFTQIADGNPEIWKDFVIGTLGLGGCKWGPRWELVGRRMLAVLQDVPRNRQEPTRLALQTSRRSDSFKDLRRCKDRLQALSETPAYWKNWAHALTGLQREPGEYRCEICDGTFYWALPAKASRMALWPCRAYFALAHTINEWEERIQYHAVEDEDEDDGKHLGPESIFDVEGQLDVHGQEAQPLQGQSEDMDLDTVELETSRPPKSQGNGL